MIEFVTRDGKRYPVKELGGYPCAQTGEYGGRWIDSFAGLWSFSVDGKPHYGVFRVKAGSSRHE